jgi:hypothetical protein
MLNRIHISLTLDGSSLGQVSPRSGAEHFEPSGKLLSSTPTRGIERGQFVKSDPIHIGAALQKERG